MASTESLGDWLRLTLTPGIGGETQRKLLRAFGLPEAIFSAAHGDLREIIGDRLATTLLGTDNAAIVQTACDWATGDNQHIVTIADPEYPQALLEIADPPTLIYVRGRLDLLNRPALAMVGSRNPTPQGVQNAERFAAAFADAGLVVASGLALGIDAAAHRGALAAGGDTIAFIGTGIDRIYPARNKDLALEIGAKGTIVSEFPLGTTVTAFNFPKRNRLISGLSQGVLVVEAAIESGSLITARLAGEQGREVFAIPGSIHNPMARGCHRLLREGAALVETPAEVLAVLGPLAADLARALRGELGGPITACEAPGEPTFLSDPRYNRLWQALGHDPTGMDDLVERTGLTTAELSSMLLALELEGQVAAQHGRYCRIGV